MKSGDQTATVLPGVQPPEDGKALRVEVNGESVAVFNLGGRLYAIGAKCTHVGGPLDEGSVTDHRVVCPWHGSVFDLESGSVVRGPAQTAVPAFRVTVVPEGLALQRL